MTMLFDLEKVRPAALNRVAKPVKRTHAGVAAPRKDNLRGASHSDHLIIDQVWRHADQNKLPPSLTNNFMSCREGDQMRKAFERERVPIMNQIRDRFRERNDLSHCLL